MMAKNGLRQRKSKSSESDGNGKAKRSIGKTPTIETAPDSSSLFGAFVKGVLGLIVLICAVVLYRRDILPGPHSSAPPRALKLSPHVSKRGAVVEAFKHAWLAYERDAMGSDNYHPISKKGSNISAAGGIGYTVVDAIDTMQIMGLKDEYERARKWVVDFITFDRDKEFDGFELTSRILGGLLSAYHLSNGDPVFLEKATDLADRIMPAFDTSSRFPKTEVNLGKRKGVNDPNNVVVLKEVTGIQLEWRQLSQVTENGEYWDRVEHVMKTLQKTKQPKGLPPVYLGSESGRPLTSEIRVGHRANALYEYLLKQYLQTDQTQPFYREMYDSSMDAIHRQVLTKSLEQNLTFTYERIPHHGERGHITWEPNPKHDHHACSLAGTLLLGATTTGTEIFPVSIPPKESELTQEGARNWRTGLALVETCVDMYRGTATGLAPEVVHFRTRDGGLGSRVGKRDWYIKDAQPPGRMPPDAARYVLGPETIGSLFVAYRLTGDDKYREYGWEIFQAIEKHCRVETGGYAGNLNVDDVESGREDRMDGVMMSATLKYLYLLFSDETAVPLDKYVLTTRAHPLPIFTPHLKRRISV